jgi:sugar phosphate isomerase/epimerase
MERTYSLAYLTVHGCPPPEMIHIAARTGYDYVSLRPIPLNLPGEVGYLPEDREMIKKTRAAMKETGIGVLDLELARIVEGVEPRSYVPAMEAMAGLGAKHVISSAWTKRTDDRDFIVDRFAEICDLAHGFGLTVNLEFPTFSRLTNLQEAADIVRAADRPNGGILIDTLYHHFSRVSLDEIRQLPDSWINFLHLCDAPRDIPPDREGMIRVARDERLYCGEGCIDFSELLGCLPPVPCSIELPNARRLQELGYEGHARRCLEAAKQQLGHGGDKVLG